MNRTARSILLRFVKRETGQSMIIVIAGMMALLGFGGVAVEAGHSYYAYQQLMASTNAATLAGAQAMPDTTAASTNITAYSSVTGNKNASTMLTNVAITPTYLCLTTVTNTLKAPCMTSSGASGGSNSVKVTQTADVPTWFAGIFGIKTFHISATSTAAMRGGTNTPWNIAIVLDATTSMGSSDGGGQCSGTRIQCALQGVQTLLQLLTPCQSGADCTTSSAFVDDVSLYVFPPMSTSNVMWDYCANGASGYNFAKGDTPTNGYYVLPTLATGYTYQVTPYSHNYQQTDTGTLYTSSNIVKATGFTGTSCAGIQAPGGSGTYYAQVIYQAQADLIAQQTANSGSRNAMIILTDGDATNTATYPGKLTGAGANPANYSSTSHMSPSTTGSLNGVTGNNPTSYTYPSALGLCGQAVVAAQAATAAGTRVVTIGYGTPKSGSCAQDATYSASVASNSNGGGAWAPGNQACGALQAMASNIGYFYSDDGAGCVAASNNNASLTQLKQIFPSIWSAMTAPRLIPNGTT